MELARSGAVNCIASATNFDNPAATVNFLGNGDRDAWPESQLGEAPAGGVIQLFRIDVSKHAALTDAY